MRRYPILLKNYPVFHVCINIFIFNDHLLFRSGRSRLYSVLSPTSFNTMRAWSFRTLSWNFYYYFPLDFQRFFYHPFSLNFPVGSKTYMLARSCFSRVLEKFGLPEGQFGYYRINYQLFLPSDQWYVFVIIDLLRQCIANQVDTKINRINSSK